MGGGGAGRDSSREGRSRGYRLGGGGGVGWGSKHDQVSDDCH